MAWLVRHLKDNVVAYLALFVALGGTTYAAVRLPANSVGTRQLKPESVTTKKLKPNAVTGAQVADGSLTGADVKAATLGKVRSAANSDTVGGSPPSAFLSGSSIAGGDLSGTQSAPAIKPDAVTGAKVADDSLTGADVDESSLADVGTGVMVGRFGNLSATEGRSGAAVGVSTGSLGVSANDVVTPSVTTIARNFQFRLTAAPGAGKSRDINLVIGGSVTSLCTISGLATTCGATGPITIPKSSTLSLQTTPNGSPADASLLFGYRLITP